MDEKYKKLIEDILHNKKVIKPINETRLNYRKNHPERMNAKLEEDLKNRTHSLGAHPAFPEGDERNFEENIISDRYYDVLKNVKKTFNLDRVDNQKIMAMQMPLVHECMELESNHKKELEELAIKMIREEFDIPEEDVEIVAELVDKISLEGTKKKPTSKSADMEFEKHSDIVEANAEVYKRRLANAMIQGASKKNHHMFHMVEDELTDLDPKLPNIYAKTMAAADYMYYIIDKMDDGVPGGVVRVELPKKEGDICKIHAQAIVFPVLIHELSKGAMEILSTHGLPEDEKIREFVMSKADSVNLEPWDMRLGPALWEKFTRCFSPEDFPLKHHVYAELMSKPPAEFNEQMKEIFAGTKEGKRIVDGILKNVKCDLKQDAFNESLESKRKAADEKIYLTPDDLNRIDLSDLGLE